MTLTFNKVREMLLLIKAKHVLEINLREKISQIFKYILVKYIVYD